VTTDPGTARRIAAARAAAARATAERAAAAQAPERVPDDGPGSRPAADDPPTTRLSRRSQQPPADDPPTSRQSGPSRRSQQPPADDPPTTRLSLPQPVDGPPTTRLMLRTERAERTARRTAGLRTGALVVGLGGALAVRLAVAGDDGVRSVGAGAAFAGLLVAVALLADRREALRPGRWRWQVAVGVLGALVLALVPLLVHLGGPGGALPLDAFPRWAAVVTAVSVAEEVLLRGVLWNAAVTWRGEWVALALTTVAFALLHVPLYGWSVLVLDLAVGLLLGGLRMLSNGWGAPAVAHTAADLAGWWLR
jgi:membrane protease YdiL (CAAX protease family)